MGLRSPPFPFPLTVACDRRLLRVDDRENDGGAGPAKCLLPPPPPPLLAPALEMGRVKGMDAEVGAAPVV